MASHADLFLLAYHLQYLCRRQFQHFVARLRLAEHVVEELHHGRHVVVVAVALRDAPFALPVEIVVFTIGDFLHHLRIQLLIVYLASAVDVGVYHARHLHH